MTLGRRLLHASVVLAVLVTAAFAALIVAVSSLREANDREARATEAVTATLRLEKLVVDLETGLRGFVLTGNERFSALPRCRGSCRPSTPNSRLRPPPTPGRDVERHTRAPGQRVPPRHVERSSPSPATTATR